MFPSALRHLGLIASLVALNTAPGQSPTDPLKSSGGFDASELLRSPTPVVVETLALDMRRTITTQTQLIRYEATAYQRKVAEARARAYMAAQRRAQTETPTPGKSSKTSKTTKTTKPSEPSKTTTKKTEKKEEPEVAVVLPKKKKVSRYVAVDTVKDERASPKAKKVVMIWDTQSESLVGNSLYDLESPPAVGSTAKFETYSAEYIGTGL